MFHRRSTQKKLMAQPLSRLGLRLAEEEHKQKDDDLNQLLVAQPKLGCQRNHGSSPDYAGSAANWLGLAICYTPLHGVVLGLPRMALSSSEGFRRVVNCAVCAFIAARRGTQLTPFDSLTLSRVVPNAEVTGLGRNRSNDER